LEYPLANALDIRRLGQIADKLDVSIDWLLGRTTVMKMPEDFEPEPLKRKGRKTA